MTNTTDLRPTGTPVTARRVTSRDANTLQILLLELADHEGDGHHVLVDVDRWLAAARLRRPISTGVGELRRLTLEPGPPTN